MVPDLLAQVEPFTGDGACNRRLVYYKGAGTGTEDVVVMVPVRRAAALDKIAKEAWSQRNSHLERIKEIGRSWRWWAMPMRA